MKIMAKDKMGFGLGLFFLFLFALLSALYNLFFVKALPSMAWLSFTESFVIALGAILAMLIIVKLAKIKNKYYQYGIVGLILGIVYFASTGIFITGLTAIAITALAIMASEGIMSIDAIKNFKI